MRRRTRASLVWIVETRRKIHHIDHACDETTQQYRLSFKIRSPVWSGSLHTVVVDIISSFENIIRYIYSYTYSWQWTVNWKWVHDWLLWRMGITTWSRMGHIATTVSSGSILWYYVCIELPEKRPNHSHLTVNFCFSIYGKITAVFYQWNERPNHISHLYL